MSYDLAIWKVSGDLDATTALSIYRSLCNDVTDGVVLADEIDAFYRELVTEYPELDDADKPSPWTCRLGHSRGHVLVTMSHSWVKDVVPFIRELASRHRLHVFDPQLGTVHAPWDKRPPIPPKPAPGSVPPRKLLAKAVVAKLTQHGFAESADRGPRGDPFSQGNALVLRRSRGALVQELRLQNWARDEVRLYVRIEHEEFGHAIAAAAGATGPVPLVDTAASILWRDTARARAEKCPRDIHPASTADDVETSATAIARSVTTYLLPLFERLATNEQLAELFNGDPDSLLPRSLSNRVLPGVGDFPVWSLVGVALAIATGVRGGNLAYWRTQITTLHDPKAHAGYIARLEALASKLSTS